MMDIGSDHWNDLRPQLTGSPAVKISSGMFPPITPSFARIDFSALNRSLPAIDQLIPGSRCGSDRPLDDFNTFRLGVEVGLIGSLCLFGFVGNALTIATLKHDSLRRKRTTNWLLQVLAVLDIVYLGAAVLSHPYRTLIELTRLRSVAAKSVVGSTVFLLVLPYFEAAANVLRSVSQTAIAWVVVLVTFDRYVAVCRPLLAVEFRTVRRAQKAVIAVGLAAIIYNIPLLFVNKLETVIDPCTNHSVTATSKTWLHQDRVYFLAYKTVCYVVLRSVGPLIVLILLNTRLAVALRLVRRRRRLIAAGRGRAGQSGGGRGPGRRENLTLMLVVVVSVFVVCELPDVCFRLTVTAFEFVGGMGIDKKASRYVNVMCNALHAVNSSINFLVYCLLGRKFRRILRRRFVVACSQATTEVNSNGGPPGTGPSGGGIEDIIYRHRTAPICRPEVDVVSTSAAVNILVNEDMATVTATGDRKQPLVVLLHRPPLHASMSV